MNAPFRAVLLPFGLIFLSSLHAAEFRVQSPHDLARGLRLGTPVFLLGEQAGQVSSMGYADDGKSIELTLNLKDGADQNVVNSTRAVMGQDQNGKFIELVRHGDFLGVRLAETRAGLLIQHVYPGTSGERMGLENGDVLFEVNDHSTKTLSEWNQVNAVTETGADLRVRFRRRGKEASLIGVADFGSGMLALPSGSTIGFSSVDHAVEMARSVSSASVAVKDAADDVIPKMDEAITSAMELGELMLEDLQGLLASTDDLMNRDVKKLLADTNGLMEEDVAKLMSQVQDTLRELDSIMNRVTPQAESTLADYEHVAVRLDRLLDQTQRMLDVVECELQYLPGTMASTQQVLCQTAEMVDAIRGHWGGTTSRESSALSAMPIGSCSHRGESFSSGNAIRRDGSPVNHRFDGEFLLAFPGKCLDSECYQLHGHDIGGHGGMPCRQMPCQPLREMVFRFASVRTGQQRYGRLSGCRLSGCRFSQSRVT